MNERILKLAVEAGVTGYFAAGTEYATPIPISGEMAKFAELIVKECAQIAVFKDSGTVATADVAGHMAAGRSIASRLIKQHFGVEE
jgi:hypothetical protein